MATLLLTTVTGDLAVTGQLFGDGAVPIGGVVAMGNAYNIPSSGAISNEGFMRADGANVPSHSLAGIPAGTTLPNLSDSRFIKVSSSAGSTGGNNSQTLDSNHLPSHSHSTDNQGAHNHNSSNNDNHNHSINRQTHWGSGATNYAGWSQDDGVGGTYGYGSSGANHSHNSSNAGSHSHNYNNAGSTNGWTKMPKYFTVIYMMRVV
tara:strand:- start:2934 stop:3548 length:615 start_codon:yes stop_codon:yes gene_type:complete